MKLISIILNNVKLFKIKNMQITVECYVSERFDIDICLQYTVEVNTVFEPQTECMDNNTIAELNDIGGIDLADIDIKFNDKTVWGCILYQCQNI